MLFEDAFEEFKIYSKNRYKKQGFYNLEKDFNYRVLPYFKNKRIDEITEKDILAWQNTILDLNFKNSYNARLYYCFNTFMKFCVLYYKLDSNAVQNVGSFKKKIELKEYDYYTLKEFRQFIRGFDNVVYKHYFELLFYTGARPSEAMALKFSDLKGNYINICKNIQRKGKRELDTPKNASSIRNVKIDNRLKHDLLKLKKIYIREFNNYNEDFYIFGGNKPLAPTSIDRYKLNACKKANIRPITTHQFRHSHATLLLQNNILINEVSRRLGHSKVSTTLDIYTHTNLEHEKRVTRTLNSLRFSAFYNLEKDFKNFISYIKHFTMF